MTCDVKTVGYSLIYVLLTVQYIDLCCDPERKCLPGRTAVFLSSRSSLSVHLCWGAAAHSLSPTKMIWRHFQRIKENDGRAARNATIRACKWFIAAQIGFILIYLIVHVEKGTTGMITVHLLHAY